jgi:hypothetical protein
MEREERKQVREAKKYGETSLIYHLVHRQFDYALSGQAMITGA